MAGVEAEVPFLTTPMKKQEDELPLRKVSLYKNDVAFYTRKGTVEKSQIVTLSFPEEDADRVVKTLKLTDYDDGFVTTF